MSTRSGTVYAKPFAKKTKIHSTTTVNNTHQKQSKQMIQIDYDSSSDYYEEVDEIPQKYEVKIDFDEASIAWRANKRRVGESWVYTKTSPPSQTGSIASRVKKYHQTK
jgi:hypothetical protein